MNINLVGQRLAKPLAQSDTRPEKTGIGKDVSAERRNDMNVKDSVAATAKKQLNAAILKSAAEVSLRAGNEPMTLTLKSVIEGINEVLQESMGENSIEKSYESGVDISPEATAGRIVTLSTAFFGAYQAQHPEMKEEEALTVFTEIIAGGIDTGFFNAQEVLKGLKVLQGDIAINIDKTYALVQDGLKSFVDSYGLIETVAVENKHKVKFKAGADGADLSIKVN